MTQKQQVHQITGLGPSVREKITRRRNAAMGYAAFNVAVTTACITYVYAFGGSRWLLILAVTQYVALVLNAGMAVRAQHALRIYRTNPVAAYIAEIRNAFGPLS